MRKVRFGLGVALALGSVPWLGGCQDQEAEARRSVSITQKSQDATGFSQPDPAALAPSIDPAISEAFWDWQYCRYMGEHYYGDAILEAATDPRWADRYRRELLARQILESELALSGLVAETAEPHCPLNDALEAKVDSLDALIEARAERQ